ncbi:ABC transporter related protein [Denitrovibrio acetiphilus DSM 12809]|uniref:ABC transporter related protein n=1 Tax=Denitrovibrio acetiphilus (strain DSM 12809 / NBRC 114555 / N2460) TaxID=522772 RepID=D4H7D7_DENA2|nr:ABC transporter ATP-binding protein [Denitrovibrio acetiphilus]ADD67936.1 ABC transporter related protein [Denitrovibrio acetiphilus DSM 12809]
MIKLNNVTKTYISGRNRETTPIKNFSVEINRGETVILSGPSGSGKSTILSMIAALLKPSSGFVEVDGQIVSKLPEHFSALYRRDKVGMIFQQFNLISGISTEDNIALPLTPSEIPARIIKELVMEMMMKLDITDRAHLSTDKLSGGEMQRVAIARALINNPSVVLADEPTANLDSRLTEELIGIFKVLKNEGRTMLIATHDSKLINCGIADRVITMTKES